MSWFSDLFGPSKPQSNPSLKPAESSTVAVKPTETKSVVPEIVDARRIDVVKTHSIIGAVDRRSNIERYSWLVEWLKLNEKEIATFALTDDQDMPKHTLALRPAASAAQFRMVPSLRPTRPPT